MISRRKLSPRTLHVIVAGLVVACVALVGLMAWMMIWHRDDKPVALPAPALQLAVGAKQHRLSTSNALTEYLTNLQAYSVMPLLIHETPRNIDWNTSDVIAVEYSMYVGRSIQNASIESVDSVSQIVIQVNEAGEGCVYAQMNKTNILFVVAPKTDTIYPISLQILPNHTTCRLN